MYGHRISGRMDFTIGAGPQFTHISDSADVCVIPGLSLTECPPGASTVETQAANHIGAAGRVSLRYRFPKTMMSLSFQRYDTSGSGVFAGSLTDTAHLDIRRPLTRVWDLFSDFGYSKNERLQVAGSTVAANTFTYGYGGVGLHRQFGRSLRGFVSYQFNELGFDTSCPVPGTTAACSRLSQRQVGSIGVDWTPRPIRLE
jgi:hypothetical protein